MLLFLKDLNSTGQHRERYGDGGAAPANGRALALPSQALCLLGFSRETRSSKPLNLKPLNIFPYLTPFPLQQPVSLGQGRAWLRAWRTVVWGLGFPAQTSLW